MLRVALLMLLIATSAHAADTEPDQRGRTTAQFEMYSPDNVIKVKAHFEPLTRKKPSPLTFTAPPDHPKRN